MKYLEINWTCVKVRKLACQFACNLILYVKLPFKGWISIQNKNCCSYLGEHEWMKMEALSCMIKYFPCFLVDFEAAIYTSFYLEKRT